MVKIPDDIPKEPPGVRRLYTPALEHHATALGYYCMEFANLESQLDMLVEDMLRCSEPQGRVIATSTGQFSNRCALASRLLYAIALPTDTDWRDQAEAHIKYCQGLAGLRNRLIHDPWILALPPATPRQWNQQAKIGAPQARLPKELLPIEERERTLASIWDAAATVATACGVMSELATGYMLWATAGETPEALQARLDRVRRLRATLPALASGA